MSDEMFRAARSIEKSTTKTTLLLEKMMADDKPLPAWAVKAARDSDVLSNPTTKDVEDLALLLVATREAALREAATVRVGGYVAAGSQSRDYANGHALGVSEFGKAILALIERDPC